MKGKPYRIAEIAIYIAVAYLICFSGPAEVEIDVSEGCVLEIPLTVPTPTPTAKLPPKTPKPTVTPIPTEVPAPDPTATPAPTPEQIKKKKGKIGIVVDLDYNSDVDDVCAVRIATQLDRDGRIELKAMASSTQGMDSAKALHAQLSHDGYGEVPIGYSTGTISRGSPYWESLIKNYYNEATFFCCDSTTLYKEVLKTAAEEEQTVRIATTGYLVNIEHLIKDPEGYELLRENADFLYVTGGEWTGGYDHNFSYTKEAAEAIKFVSENCPIPIVFSSYLSIQEEEGFVMCGGAVLQKDVAQKDPITIAFRSYEERNEADLSAGRFAWDPICVWAACLPEEETQMRAVPISVWIGNDGCNAFSDYNGLIPPRHYILMRNSPELGWYKNQLEILLTKGIP